MTRNQLIASLAHNPELQAEAAKQLKVRIAPKVVIPKDGYDSNAERLYAQHLAVRQVAREIIGWRRAPLTIRLADKTTYTPDFLVAFPDGSLEIVEVKGHEREDDRIKFNTAAELLPWIAFRMVRRRGSGWETRRMRNAGGRVRT